MKTFVSNSAKETEEIAYNFAKTLSQGDIVALSGELGAGKTAFVKGIARYFNIAGETSSPTFTIVNEYNGDIDLFHFDAYRLENIDETNLDWLDDYLFGDGICLIEWAENIMSILPDGYIKIDITKNPDSGSDYREITIC